MVKKARRWVKETILGVAGTVLTATVLGMLGFSSGSSSSGGTAPILASSNPARNQLQTQLAGALQQFATKASATATAVARDHLKKQAAEQVGYAADASGADYQITNRVQTTSFNDRQRRTMPARYSSETEFAADSSAGRYGSGPVPNAGESPDTAGGRYGAGDETQYVQTTDSGDAGRGETGFKSNTAATVAANDDNNTDPRQPQSPSTHATASTQATATTQATPLVNSAARQEPRPGVITQAEANQRDARLSKGIEGQWEQLVYNPDDQQWYSGGIYRVTKEQQAYRLAVLDTSRIEPVFVSIAGIRKVSQVDGVWSFESHLDGGEVLQFKLEKKDDSTFQGYCYQDGVQLAVNAWRRVSGENLK